MTRTITQPQRAVFAGFALHAVSMGSIFPRLPAIRDQMGVGEGALGLALIGTPVGTLIALTFAASAIERIGYRRTILAAIPLTALFFAIAVQAGSPLMLFLLLIPAGFSLGCSEIVLNVEADRTEVIVGRRIMNRAHSMWSFGFFVAGVTGAGMAYLGVSPEWHLAVMVPAIGLGVAVFLGRFRAAPARGETADASPTFAMPSKAILVLVAVTLSAMLMEGAGIDWSAIYMTNVFDTSTEVAGFAVAVVALSQAFARYVADGFIDRRSPAEVGRNLLICLAVGIVLVIAAPHPAVGFVGFAMMGVGTSVIFPLAMSAAAQRTDRPASVNVAALAQISFVAFLFGPPLLGYVAEHLGVRWAYGFGLPLVALSLMTVGALGRRPVSA